MWLQPALFFSACLSTAAAIYSDEVNHIDFHHALLGTPSPDSTFFLKPSTSSNASLLYTLSDKLLVGAVNPPRWHAGMAPEHLAVGGLALTWDGNDAVVATMGNYIASWGAQDGKLGWENQVSQGAVADLELLELVDATATFGVRDTIAVIASEGTGIVRRLDGNTGKSVWEFKDASGDLPFQVSSSSTEIFYISLQSGMLKGFKIKVTVLDPLTGQQIRQQILNSEADVATSESVLYVGANSASPIIVWADKSQKSLKVNVIGTKEITSIAIDNTTGSEIRKITVHAPQHLNALPHFLVHFETESGAWAEVYHVDLVSAKVTKAYRLPYLPGQSAVAASVIDANVYFTRITDQEATVVSSASHGILGRWDLQKPSSNIALHSVSEVVAKGKSVAVRSALFRKHGDWQLIRNGQIEWTRHEGLIDAVAATWAETDTQEDLAHELEIEGHDTLYGAYLHRVKRHVRDLEHLPDWLKDLPKRILSSILTDEVSNLDSFGVAKSVIVATKNGHVYALDTGNHGAVSWGIQAVETSQWNVKAILASPGVATIYSDDGSSVTVDVSTGEIVSRIESSNSKLHSIAVFGAQDGSSLATVGVSEDGTPITAFADEDGFLVTTSVDGRVLGWKVVEATARPAHDPVASIGRVLGNRSVLYKYLNPNLALVTAVNEQTHTASFYLLDGVSGKVLHAVTQAGVDSKQPIASVMSENWFAYSFWGDVDGSESSAKGYQLVISELYESPFPNDRGVLDSTTNYSSTATLPLPHVISQAFMIPEPISHMAVTQTRQGITTRQLLCTLPSSNSLVGIPRPVLDPRRPVDRDPTTAEAEEGLFRYAPYLDFDGKWYLSHTRDVAGIKAVLSCPTLLESTSLIFAYGSDIYGTRATPSQAFDILGKSFSKLQLVLTVVALGAGVTVLAPMTRRKQVNALWRA
ncbi:hypothetical protein N7516_001637 [Penicillium verrucosum]|uniref:uncharacterized protein n=1 Tax=Penicillium verrucosum TaxID=60171 RepID=UPI002544E4DA|nr:uncharacterized protein N7516_001637 [Penicillium verrucosum]KAJ5941469.1 hypothetical protein N7516_001637 [Penicillium verrucosum]